MVTKTVIMKNEYFDSFTQIRLSEQLNNLTDVIHATILMGTDNNKKRMMDLGVPPNDLEPARPNDLVISIQGTSEERIERAFQKAQQFYAEEEYTIYPFLDFPLWAIIEPGL